MYQIPYQIIFSIQSICFKGFHQCNFVFFAKQLQMEYTLGAFNTKKAISNSCTHVESLKSCLLTTLVIIHLKIPLCLATQE